MGIAGTEVAKEAADMVSFIALDNIVSTFIINTNDFTYSGKNESCILAKQVLGFGFTPVGIKQSQRQHLPI